MGPTAMVQSGGSQPVAAMPAKLAPAIRAGAGSMAASAMRSAPAVAGSSAFRPVSGAAVALPRASLTLWARSLSLMNSGSGIG